MSRYKEKLSTMQDFISDNIDSVEELCVMFDITLEEVVAAFPDKLVKGYGKVYAEEDDEDQEELDGFRIFSPEDEG
jgi:hypothetical protein